MQVKSTLLGRIILDVSDLVQTHQGSTPVVRIARFNVRYLIEHLNSGLGILNLLLCTLPF
jgi:hypothetical protein